jgi:hypothetical protein
VPIKNATLLHRFHAPAHPLANVSNSWGVFPMCFLLRVYPDSRPLRENQIRSEKPSRFSISDGSLPNYDSGTAWRAAGVLSLLL